jgi:hypothetical protein
LDIIVFQPESQGEFCGKPDNGSRGQRPDKKDTRGKRKDKRLKIKDEK